MQRVIAVVVWHPRTYRVTWNNEEAVWKRLYEKRLKEKGPRPKFKVGDRVRLNKIHRTFEKGYLPGLWYIAWCLASYPPIRFASGMIPR